jgi:hypothetical protein
VPAGQLVLLVTVKDGQQTRPVTLVCTISNAVAKATLVPQVHQLNMRKAKSMHQVMDIATGIVAGATTSTHALIPDTPFSPVA